MVISLYQDLSEIKTINHTFQLILIHWSLILKVLTVRLIKPHRPEQFFLDKFFDALFARVFDKQVFLGNSSLIILICSRVSRKIDNFSLTSCFARYFHLFVNFSLMAVHTSRLPCSKARLISFSTRKLVQEKLFIFTRTLEQIKIVTEKLSRNI